MMSLIVVRYSDREDLIAEWPSDRLGSAVKELSQDVKVDLVELIDTASLSGVWEYVPVPEGPGGEWSTLRGHDYLSIMRGEKDIPAHPETSDEYGLDENGRIYYTVRHKTSELVFRVIDDVNGWDLNFGHIQFEDRNGWGWIDHIVPRRHRFIGRTGVRLTRTSITPWVPVGTTPPISKETQVSRIENHLREWPLDLRSVLLCGPVNTSKTTFAAAYITDIITYRVSLARLTNLSTDFHPCVWSLSLNEWFDSYLTWKTRDFGGETDKSFLTTEEIKRTSESMGLPPVLWIEELDKVKITDTNRDWLHTLINRVYQMEGCVIATTNEPIESLRKKFGEGIVGRLDGSRDGEDGHVCLNFAPPNHKKKAA